MQILLCAATELEIKPTITFIRNKLWDENVDLLITGVGLTAATYTLTKYVSTYRPGLIIQAGVAGALNPDLSLGEVVLIQSEVIGDEGVQENGTFHSLFDLGLADAQKGPFTNGRMINSHKELIGKAGMRLVNSVTVNQISTSAAQVDYYREILCADVESMEGAALHYVALAESLPFMQIRAVSNYIGERDKSKWVLKDAIAHLNDKLQSILIKLLNA